MATNPPRLNTPGRDRSWLPRFKMSPETFGDFAEAFARFMGTARFLIWMSLFIIAWVMWNTFSTADGQTPGKPDPYPFIFLTLLLSLQASYAAPLILLAQNRQEARDRVSLETDRQVAAQSRADMDFLAREIASLRMRINDMPTRDFVRSELRDLLDELRDADGDDSASKENGRSRRDR